MIIYSKYNCTQSDIEFIHRNYMCKKNYEPVMKCPIFLSFSAGNSSSIYYGFDAHIMPAINIHQNYAGPPGQLSRVNPT